MAVEYDRVGSVAAHGVSISAVIGVFMHVLPPVLALLGSLLAVVWYSITISETKTVQAWIVAWKAKRTKT